MQERCDGEQLIIKKLDRANKYVKKMLDFCGLKDVKEAYDHITPVNIGTYKNSGIEWSKELIEEMAKFGYK